VTIYPARFTNRVAVITGGASGVGRTVCERLAAEGAKVSLWDMNAAALDNGAEGAGASHTRLVDVSSPEEVAEAARETHALLGRIDILIVAAGITGATAPVQDFPVESWRQVIDVNLNGAFYCCRAVVPYMLKDNYGRIVNISSVAGKEGNPNASAYSASKAGLICLTKSLGKELAETGIRVNSVTPAVFTSPLLLQMPQSHIDYMLSKIPMGRFGEMDEVAAMVCWLASEECSFSTGATFDISGGRTTY
jgi:3-oxoacyl-[acyl-carrier protein] reductase